MNLLLYLGNSKIVFVVYIIILVKKKLSILFCDIFNVARQLRNMYFISLLFII